MTYKAGTSKPPRTTTVHMSAVSRKLTVSAYHTQLHSKNKHIKNPTITHTDHIIRYIRNLKQYTKVLENGKGETSMRYPEKQATAANTLIKRHAPNTHTTPPTEQPIILSKTTELKIEHTSPRLTKPLITIPPLKTSDMPSLDNSAYLFCC